jgi:uncharacterized membrane protein
MVSETQNNTNKRVTDPSPGVLLTIIVISVVTIVLVVLDVSDSTLVGSTVGLFLVLVAPGYGIIAAIDFQSRSDDNFHSDFILVMMGGRNLSRGRIDRFILAVLASVLLTGLVALLVRFTASTYTTSYILSGNALLAMGTSLFALHQQKGVQVTVYVRNRFDSAGIVLWNLWQQDRVLVGLSIGIILISGGAVAGYSVFDEPEQYTEFYLLNENDSGELVADYYSRSLSQYESSSVYFGIENHESTTERYTVVTKIQRIDLRNNKVEIQQQRTLSQTSIRLGPNQRIQRRQQLTAEIAGDRVRFAFLLYRGQVPSQPTVANAYRKLHLWINVS